MNIEVERARLEREHVLAWREYQKMDKVAKGDIFKRMAIVSNAEETYEALMTFLDMYSGSSAERIRLDIPIADTAQAAHDESEGT